jgi:hypothetical protein
VEVEVGMDIDADSVECFCFFVSAVVVVETGSVRLGDILVYG